MPLEQWKTGLCSQNRSVMVANSFFTQKSLMASGRLLGKSELMSSGWRGLQSNFWSSPALAFTLIQFARAETSCKWPTESEKTRKSVSCAKHINMRIPPRGGISPPPKLVEMISTIKGVKTLTWTCCHASSPCRTEPGREVLQ